MTARPLLSAKELKGRLGELTLPKGMRATVKDDPWEGPFLWLVWTVEDSFKPGESVDLGVKTYLSPNDRANGQAFDAFVTWRVWRMFGHEAREQVQRGGVPLSNPHTD